MDLFHSFLNRLNPRQSDPEKRNVFMAGGGSTVQETAQKVQQEPNPIHTSIENRDMLAESSDYSFLKTSRSHPLESGFEMTPNFKLVEHNEIAEDGNKAKNMHESLPLGDEFEMTMNAKSVKQKETSGVENNDETKDFFFDESLEYSFIQSSKSNPFGDGFETILNVKSVLQKEIEWNEENMDFLDESLGYSSLETSRSSNAHVDGSKTPNVERVELKEIEGNENNKRMLAETGIPASDFHGLVTSRTDANVDGLKSPNVKCVEQKKKISEHEKAVDSCNDVDLQSDGKSLSLVQEDAASITSLEDTGKPPDATGSIDIKQYEPVRTQTINIAAAVEEFDRANPVKSKKWKSKPVFPENSRVLRSRSQEKAKHPEQKAVKIENGLNETRKVKRERKKEIARDGSETPDVNFVELKEITGNENNEMLSAETGIPASELYELETSRIDACVDGPKSPNVKCVEQKKNISELEKGVDSCNDVILQPDGKSSSLVQEDVASKTSLEDAGVPPTATGSIDIKQSKPVQTETIKFAAADEEIDGANPVQSKKRKSKQVSPENARVLRSRSQEKAKLSEQKAVIIENGLNETRKVKRERKKEIARDGSETPNVKCVELKEVMGNKNNKRMSAETGILASELYGLETLRIDAHGDGLKTPIVKCVEQKGNTGSENNETGSTDIKQSESVQTETVNIAAAGKEIDGVNPGQSKKRKSKPVSPENARVLRSRSQEKAKLPEQKAVKIENCSNETRKVKRGRKKKMKNLPVNEFSRIRKHLRYLLHRIKFEQSYIDAYSCEGWKRQSLEKIKPEKELKRARSQILSWKMKIRDLFQYLDASLNQGKLPETLFDSEGEIDGDDIFCAKCGTKDVTLDNDIILCDGACDRGFHQFCLDPPLLKKDIPIGDEGWLCPGCDCKDDCCDILNDFQGSRLSILDNWEKIFPKEAAAKASGKNIDDISNLQSEDSDDNDYNPDENSCKSEYVNGSDEMLLGKKLLDLPSDDSEDEDFDPIAPHSEENDRLADHESSNSEDFTSDSEDLGAVLEENNVDNKDEGCVSSFSNYTKPDKVKGRSLCNELTHLLDSDDATPLSGKRHIERLDYKKLHDETYGDATSDSSDEEYGEKTGRKRRKNSDGDDAGGDVKAASRSVICKQARKSHTDPRAGNDCLKVIEQALDTSAPNLQRSLNERVKEEKSSEVGSSGKSRKLGEEATKKLCESFNENQYPKKDVKDSLANELGLRVQQVDHWFTTARKSFRITNIIESTIAKIKCKNSTTVPSTRKLNETTTTKLEPATTPSYNEVEGIKPMLSSPEKDMAEVSTPKSRVLRCKKNNNAGNKSGKNIDDISNLQSKDSDDTDYIPDENSRKSEYINGWDAMILENKLLELPSDDSEDDDFDPNAPPSEEDDQPATVHESSFSEDVTSDSEDLDAVLQENGVDNKDEGCCVSSLSNYTKPDKVKGRSLCNELTHLIDSDASPFSGKRAQRHVERLDYKKLHDETYGDATSDSSDDEYREKIGKKRGKNGDGDGIATTGSVRCKRARKSRTDPRAGNDCLQVTEQGLETSAAYVQSSVNESEKEEKKSCKVESSCKSRILGEEATQRLLESFNENQYPKKDLKDNLADELGLRVQQVNHWFKTARKSVSNENRIESTIARTTTKLETATTTELTPPPSCNEVEDIKPTRSSPEKVTAQASSTPKSRVLRRKKKNNVGKESVSNASNNEPIANQGASIDKPTVRRKSTRLHRILLK